MVEEVGLSVELGSNVGELGVLWVVGLTCKDVGEMLVIVVGTAVVGTTIFVVLPK